MTCECDCGYLGAHCEESVTIVPVVMGLSGHGTSDLLVVPNGVPALYNPVSGATSTGALVSLTILPGTVQLWLSACDSVAGSGGVVLVVLRGCFAGLADVAQLGVVLQAHPSSGRRLIQEHNAPEAIARRRMTAGTCTTFSLDVTAGTYYLLVSSLSGGSGAVVLNWETKDEVSTAQPTPTGPAVRMRNHTLTSVR